MSFFDFLDPPPPEVQTLRGGKVLDADAARKGAADYGGPTVPLLGLDLPERLSHRGVVFQGQQGCGKTLTILRSLHRVLDRINREGPAGKGKVVVFDLKGDMTAPLLAMARAVHPPLPVYLLNPFDRLARAVDPHEFTGDPTKITRLVHALTYRGRDARTDAFFDSSARGHLVDLVKILRTRVGGAWTWRHLLLIATDQDLFQRVLENSRLGQRKAKSLVRKTFSGVVATIQAWLEQYEAVFACYERSPPFRLDEFLRGRGVVVVIAPEDQIDSVNPLVRTLLRNVKDRLLTDNGRDPVSHTTVVLDEFAYLENCVESLEPLFGRSRSASVSVLCAWQSWPAVCAAHTEGRMKGVVDNAAVRVYFGSGACSATTAAADCATSEVKRRDESTTVSRGVVTSTSVSHRVEQRGNVLAGEVQSLAGPTTRDLTVRAFVCASHLPGAVYCEEDYGPFVAYLNELPKVAAVRPRPDAELWMEPWDDAREGKLLEALFTPEPGTVGAGGGRRRGGVQEYDE